MALEEPSRVLAGGRGGFQYGWSNQVDMSGMWSHTKQRQSIYRSYVILSPQDAQSYNEGYQTTQRTIQYKTMKKLIAIAFLASLAPIWRDPLWEGGVNFWEYWIKHMQGREELIPADIAKNEARAAYLETNY